MNRVTPETLLDNPPAYASEVAALARWSENYDRATPYDLFLDLIGYSGEEWGMVTFGPQWREKPQDKCGDTEVSAWSLHPRDYAIKQANLIDARIGYLELGMLADALKQYAENPHDVIAYVRELAQAERGDDD